MELKTTNSSETSRGLDQQLDDLWFDLSDGEKNVLIDLIKKAKFTRSGRTEIDEISVVREYLTASLEEGGFSFDIPDKIPEMVKSYTGSKETQLKVQKPSCNISELIATRSSVRDFHRKPMKMSQLSELLYTAYGVKGFISAYGENKFPTRIVPSSGGLQSTETYLIVNDVEGLEQGLYHFNPVNESLQLIDLGIMRRTLVKACSSTDWIGNASVVLALTCDLNKLIWKYGRRAYKMSHIDLGIVAENFHLVAHDMELGSCMLAGFDENQLNTILNIDGKKEFIGLLIAVGHPLK